MVNTVIGVLVGLTLAAAASADDITDITDLYSRWDNAVQSSSIEGYIDVLDQHVRLILPGAPDVEGRDNYAAFLQNVLPVAAYRLELLGEIDIDVVGDVALVEYHKKIEMTLASAQTITEPGALNSDISVNKYIDVLRRQEDGGWKVYRHAWTPSEYALSQ